MRNRRSVAFWWVGCLSLVGACSSGGTANPVGDAATPRTDAATSAEVSDLAVSGLAARVTPGSTIALVASPAIQVSWTATCGALSSTDGTATTWTAPANAAECSVTASAPGAAAEVSTRVTWATTLVARDATGDEGAPGFDIEALYYGVSAGVLYVEATLSRFDPDTAQVEIFLRREEPDQPLHSLGWTEGVPVFWAAERPVGHPHYHWQVVGAPSSLDMVASPTILTARVSLSDVSLGDQTAAQIGIAGAPTLVDQSAQYTDRLPDDTEVTPTDIVGLTTIALR